ncbi:hypothetical protein SLA2020_005810 [Shorea laevis]
MGNRIALPRQKGIRSFTSNDTEKKDTEAISCLSRRLGRKHRPFRSSTPTVDAPGTGSKWGSKCEVKKGYHQISKC